MSSEVTVPRMQYGAVIGEGGMGTVLEARQHHLGRTIAVKRLHAERSNAKNVEALLAEARITSAVAHPSVVPIHDLGIGDDGQPEILLKRIDGRPWSHLLRDPLLVERLHQVADPLAFHVRVLRQVCEAIHAAHRQGIVHRDLKPNNIMIGRLGEVYVLDWGLAATLDPNADPRLPRPTRHGGGTPQYMAPEMVADRYGALGPWTDVYLLGGLLFYILNKRPPHPGATSWNMVIEACEQGTVVPDTGPPALVDLCRRCLHGRPRDRLQDADTVRRELQTWLDRRASVDLAQEGQWHADLLEQRLSDPEAESTACHAHFGAAVFAFQRALDEWPDNDAAQVGLNRVVHRLVAHELDRGCPERAHLALSAVADAPNALVRRARWASRLTRWQLGRQRVDVLAAVVAFTALVALAVTLVGPVGWSLVLMVPAVLWARWPRSVAATGKSPR